MKKTLIIRLLSVLLVIALLTGFAVPVNAVNAGSEITFTQVDNDSVSVDLREPYRETPSDTPTYADTDMVRVSIILKEQSTLGAGYVARGISANPQAMQYRAGLQERQAAVTASIEKVVDDELDVVWNLTLAANIISANIPYGRIEDIENVPGVDQVLIETRYEPDVVEREEMSDPNMATSGIQIGSATA